MFNKKIASEMALGIIVLVALIFGGLFLWEEKNSQEFIESPKFEKNNPVACTQEAKECPDGSFVSRTGPNCEFSPCPVSEKNNTEPLIGGDKDKHGCLGSAGYSWCETKNKCLRIWEETCEETLEKQIQYLLALKYAKELSEVKITVRKQIGDHASGSVIFGTGDEIEGGLFLAYKKNGIWTSVYDGNGSVDCNLMKNEYQFPAEILSPNFCD